MSDQTVPFVYALSGCQLQTISSAMITERHNTACELDYKKTMQIPEGSTNRPIPEWFSLAASSYHAKTQGGFPLGLYSALEYVFVSYSAI